MKKLVNISIGGLAFRAEEDAYARLETYLAGLRSHFAGLAAAEEIAADIEARLGEQFEGRVGGNGILTLTVVEELLRNMGEPGDFGAAPETGAAERPPAPAPALAGKRLMRDKDGLMISGVCGGVAAYLGLDPVWVRLAFALSVFFGGFGIILYVILWIIMPEARTGTEKMQMRGDPINLKEIERTLKERAQEFKRQDHTQARRLLTAPFKALGRAGAALGRACGGLLPLFMKFLGGCLLVAGSLAIAALIIAVASLAFNANSPYLGLPPEITVGPLFYSGVASAFLVVFVPLLFLALLGASLLAGRAACGKLCAVALLSLWVGGLAVFANVAVKYAPRLESAYNNLPGSQTVSRNLELKNFNNIKLASACRARVYPSKNFSVTFTGCAEDLDGLHAAVADGTLTVKRKPEPGLRLFRRREPLRLEIGLPELAGADLNGASRLAAAGFSPAAMALRLAGASRAELDLNTRELRAELTGASRLRLKGRVAAGEFKASGASEVLAEEAEVEKAAVDLSGASRARFGRLKTLSGEAQGASEVSLLSAAARDVELSGASRIRER